MAVQLSISQGTALGAFPAVLRISAFQYSAITLRHHMQKVNKTLQALMWNNKPHLLWADITNAKQLCDHLTANFSKPAQSPFRSCSTAVSLKKRLFFYVPADGEEAVPRHREGRRFNTIKGIRKLHSVVTSPRQLKVLVRQCSCYCSECLYENYPGCKNKE